MAQRSSIEWTDATWNPVTGCSKVSPGCKHCYAHRMAHRLQAMGQPRYSNGFRVTLHDDLLQAPLRWRSPRRIFVNSMSDLFHGDVPLEFIRRVFRTMAQAEGHVFQVLTKRPGRAVELSPLLEWPDNVWMGVSVETADYVWRARLLQRIPAAVRFLSLEPLLGPVGRLPLSKIDWVIVGGESGPRARPMLPEWARSIRDQCTRGAVPFFFKQWGGTWQSDAGRQLDGLLWDEMPASSLASGLSAGGPS